MMLLLMTLIACGPSSDDIVKNLSSTNPVVREDTAKIARNFGSDSVESGLISVLGDPEPKVRLNAVESLVELETKAAVPSLMERLELETDPRVQRAVIDALGRLKDTRAVPALITFLEKHIESPPLNAVWALGNLEDDRALNVLAPLRTSTDQHVVWNVNQALRKLKPAPNPAG
jgi:HEAT repeat protein